MSGVRAFFLNLVLLLQVMHKAVELVDVDSNLQMTGTDNLDFKLESYIVAVHNVLYVPRLVDSLSFGIDFGVRPDCGFAICGGSS
eukprot:15324157-Ditylum_brightwellii.AAC.1